MTIADNAKKIAENIKKITDSEGIKNDVTIVGVTKTRGVEAMRELSSCGIKNFGENRVQEFAEKYPAFGDEISWHLIGTLQKNKVKYIVGKTSLIHSVDSCALAAEIDRVSKKNKTVTEILLQVNTAKEESKHGFYAEDISDALEEVSGMTHILVRGLMCIAPNTEDVAYLARIFEKTRNIFDDMMNFSEKYDNIKFEVLSMGMSNDYETAVKCGANTVRLGRILFE